MTDKALGLPDCDECNAAITWNLVAACASVGIERRQTTTQALVDYLAALHSRAHAQRSGEVAR